MISERLAICPSDAIRRAVERGFRQRKLDGNMRTLARRCLNRNASTQQTCPLLNLVPPEFAFANISWIGTDGPNSNVDGKPVILLDSVDLDHPALPVTAGV